MKKTSAMKRVLSLLLALTMLVGYVPVRASAAEAAGIITTVADPETLTRPQDIYGNDTENAGKITVGKSVTDQNYTLDSQNFTLTDPNNFLVTISQSAQVAGLSSEMSVPMDVVFVLDTSGSMKEEISEDVKRSTAVVNAANSAIKTLMEANPYNRIGVVAFSGSYSSNSSSSAATQLSALAHYTGNAATNHLTVNGNNVTGRGSGAGSRAVENGGTSIHSGVYLGAQMLTNADTTVTIDGQVVTRMPFLVILSDGGPTYSCASENWYTPSIRNNNQQGPGNNPYPGNGFLAAITAAYYKGAITDHYYGANASEDKRCFIYTIGVGFNHDDMTQNEKDLAMMTLDPNTYLTDDDNNYYDEFVENYWKNYAAGTAFNVTVKGSESNRMNKRTYTVTAASITATKNYVNGNRTVNGQPVSMYEGGLAYNDDHFTADSTEEINKAFDQIVSIVAEKSISSPTAVTSTPEFSGYVTFTDPIGEYMEVKNVKGIYANGILYAGTSAAAYLSSRNANAEFNESLREVLHTRLTMAASQNVDALVEELISGRAESENIRDNSITWWGNTVDNNDPTVVQCLAYADGDTIEYIEANKAAHPNADVLCRSYLFYGTAGGTAGSQTNHNYMYFVVRVQRELVAPYRQTVVISAPASLLSVDEVLITEEADGTFTAKVTNEAPARVIYEVGLRSDINSYNVASIVSNEYKTEAGNVDANGNYVFYTNDWDRTASGDAHHKAMAKATFDAAQDNPFYAYQEDTTVLGENGNPYRGNTEPSGTYYYNRTYYEWGNTPNSDGTYSAVQKTVPIQIYLPGNSDLVERAADGTWYIKAGTYTASSLVVNGDDTYKDDPTTSDANDGNFTGTATIVAHPHRTNTATDSHYTVLLGNNGKLTIKAQEFKKNVAINPTAGETTVYDDDGKAVTIGDILEYQIVLPNVGNEKVTMTVTDTIPDGTEFVSAANGGEHNNGVITWTNVEVPEGGTTLTFQVRVTDAVYAGATPIVTIDNQAQITMGGHTYTTNVTHNPPEYKKVETSAATPTTPLKVGDTLTYTINWYNDSGAVADVTVTDIIPAGTTLVNPGLYNVGQDGKTITWFIDDAPANATGTVDFTVYVNASASTEIKNHAEVKIGNNDPCQTNETTNTVGKGDISVSKTVLNGKEGYQGEGFTLNLAETGKALSGTYELYRNGTKVDKGISFVNGAATLTEVKHNDIFVIKNLPLGVTIQISESAKNGWTPAYSTTNTVTVSDTTGKADAADVDLKVTNEHTPAPVTFQLKGSKTFSGPFPAGEYTFSFTAQQHTLKDDGTFEVKDAARYATATVIGSSGTQNFVFDAVTFTEPIGPLYYKIKEVYSQHAGVITDAKEYMLKLEIVADNSGSLVANASYSTDGGTNWITDWDATKDGTQTWKDVLDGTSASPITFTNIYPAPTSVTITGTKTLTGRNITADDSFIFELLDADKKPLANTGLTGTITGEKNSESFQFLRHYAVTDLIVNGERLNSREFTYYIREAALNAEGMAYDSTLYKVVVTVSLGTDNNLTANVSSINKVTTTDEGEALTSANAITFANTFTPDDIAISLATTKTLSGEGAYALKGGEFSFSVYQTESDFNTESDKAKLVAGGSNGAADETTNTANVNLGTIPYVPADIDEDGNGVYEDRIFYYVIKENIPSQSLQNYDYSMTYDATVYKLKVFVDYKTNGKMEISYVNLVGADGEETPLTGVENANKIPVYTIAGGFTNTRVKDEIPVTPVVYKTTTGANLPAGLSFSFAVRKASVEVEGETKTLKSTSDTVTTGLSAATETGDGANRLVTFGAINYTAADLGSASSRTDYYLIEESNAAATNGVTYDQDKFVMEVTLSRANPGAALEISATYYVVGENNVLTKLDNFIQDNLPEEQKKWTEVSGTKYPWFYNTYNANAHINLTATKTLTGRDMKEREFDFRLQRLVKNADGTTYSTVAGSAVDGANIAANNGVPGAVNFGTLNFNVPYAEGNKLPTTLPVGYEAVMKTDEGNTDQVDYYLVHYLMSEISETAVAGVTPGGQKYVVTIKLQWAVDDTGNKSSLAATVHSICSAGGTAGAYTIGDTASAATFTNTYNVASADVTITATKKLTGREMRVGEFTFNLYRENRDADGNVVSEVFLATATNDADKKITFKRTFSPSVLSTAAFGDDNQYTVYYRLEEVPITTGGVTGDNSKYWVKVVITHDIASGAYKINPGDITYYNNQKLEVDSNWDGNITFHNQYKTTGTTFNPDVDKVMLDAADHSKKLPIPEQKFNFNVYEGNTLVGSGSTKASTAPEGTTNYVSEIDFTPISITTAGVHTYRIEEIVGSDATIPYEKANKVYVTIEVTDDGYGNLVKGTPVYYKDAEFKDPYGENEAIQITNYKSSGEVVVNLGVQKTVQIEDANGNPTGTNYPLADSEFDFYVTDYTPATETAEAVLGTTEIADGTNDDKGNIVFDDIVISLDTFDKEDTDKDNSITRYYAIRERAKAGNTKLNTDPNYIVAKVTVTKNEYKNLSYAVEYTKSGKVIDEADNVFVNKYTHTAIPVVLTGTKTLIGKDLAKDEFSFELYEKQLDGTYKKVNEVTNGVEKPDSADSEKMTLYVDEIAFGTLNFNAPGTYTYYVKEVKKDAVETDPGTYGYDEKIIYVEVNVIETLGTEGLAATVSYYTKDAENNKVPYSGIAFTNTYSPKAIPLDINVPLDITKSIVDESGNPLDMPLDGFKFELVGLLDKDGKPVTVTGTSNEKGIVNFDDIYFTEPGPFTFTILESANQSADKQGYLVDGTRWVVNVMVSYNGTTASVPYTNVNGEAAVAAPGQLYIAQGHVNVQKVDPTAQELEETTPALLANDAQKPVSFVNTYNPTPASVTVTATKKLTGRDLRSGEFIFRLVSGDIIAAQATNDADGNIAFHLNYTGKDMNDPDDVDENGNVYKIFTYTMKEVGATTEAPGVSTDGKTYEVTVKVVDIEGVLTATASVSGDATFTNTYTPASTTATIQATKLLEGWDLSGATFNFLLKDEGDNVVQTVPNQGANIAFKLSYDADDMLDNNDRRVAQKVFKYTIVEEKGAIEGMTYDDAAFGVTVTVTDDLKGQLHASVAYDNPPVFVNVYDGKDAPVSLQASKVLNGRTLKAGEFTFQLLDSNGTVISEAKNDADGKITFASFTLGQAGTYTYTIREVAGNEAGMTYDKTEAKVTVEVKQATDGSYVATIADGTPVFVNEFHQTSVAVQAKKVLETSASRVLKAGEFTFQLLDKDGKVVETATNDEKGNVTFPAFSLYQAGTYQYTIQEAAGKESGMTYDAAKYGVTVKVTENKAGALETAITYATENGAVPTFVNKYEPAPAKLTVTAQKKLTGRNLVEGEFTFQLRSGKTVVAETTNKVDGTVAFDLTYTAKDLAGGEVKDGKLTKTVTYTVAELIPESGKGREGVIYDTAVGTVTVTLTDNNGKLEVNGKTAVTVDSGVTFHNVYTADSAPVTIKATKKLEGWNLTDSGAAFRFLLTPVDQDGKAIEGAKVLTASNDAKGNITFPELTYELADLDGAQKKAFYYQITEEAGTVSGMTYDDAKFTVTVTVTNDGKGKLTTEVKYDQEPVFVNSYDGADAPVTIRAKKVLDTTADRTVKAGEFTFQLLDKKGNVVQKATNDAKGNVVFETFTLAEAGTYQYTIREVAGSETGMTYDKTKVSVTVEVKQTKDGSYEATITYDTEDGAEPVFVNEYKPQPAKITLTGTKKLTGRSLRKGEFNFRVHDSKGNLVATGTNDRKGNIVFSEMKFTTPGTYVLKVSEVKGSARYMTYDTDTFQVIVTVTKENGVLSASAVAAKEIVFQNHYTPPTSNPKTGDEMPLMPMVLMMLSSAAALAAVLVFQKKRRSR